MDASLSCLNIYQIGGHALGIFMLDNEANNIAGAWAEFTRRYKGPTDNYEEEINPMIRIRGKANPQSMTIVDWYLDMREIQCVSVAS